VDSALIESFWSTMQRELLDRQPWSSMVELAPAIFEWIEGWYNPVDATSLGNLSARVRNLHKVTLSGMITYPKRVRETGSGSSCPCTG
jgi:hypothetical protein